MACLTFSFTISEVLEQWTVRSRQGQMANISFDG